MVTCCHHRPRQSPDSVGRKSLWKKICGREGAKPDLLTGADSSGLLRKDWGCLQPPPKLPRESDPWLGYKASQPGLLRLKGTPAARSQNQTLTLLPQTLTVPELQRMPGEPVTPPQPEQSTVLLPNSHSWRGRASQSSEGWVHTRLLTPQPQPCYLPGSNDHEERPFPISPGPRTAHDLAGSSFTDHVLLLVRLLFPNGAPSTLLVSPICTLSMVRVKVPSLLPGQDSNSPPSPREPVRCKTNILGLRKAMHPRPPRAVLSPPTPEQP